MNRTAVLLILAAAIGGCNRAPSVEAHNASVEEVAARVRDATRNQAFVSPGKWISTVTIDDLAMTGMPGEMASRMKSAMAEQQGRQVTTCLTEAQAKRPSEDFFTGKDNQCRYDHFTMAHGKIDAAMRCGGGPDGAGQLMTMSGTYAPDTYRMQMSSTSQGSSGPAAGMTMKMHIESRRVGACDGKEPA